MQIHICDTESKKLDWKSDLISLLVYFDIFKFPLTLRDLSRMTGYTESEFVDCLNSLVKIGRCFEYHGYYSLESSIKTQVENRIESEERAHHFWQKLPAYVRIISRFPFVQGLAVSGSLSKGVMTHDGDIDYFVVTTPGRLWLCRSLLIAYKKVALLNSRKYFCLNYFVDTDHLEIRDKNIFTAVEVAHLIPVYDSGSTFENFYKQNSWVSSYLQLPASIAQSTNHQHPFFLQKIFRGKAAFTKQLEFILGTVGNTLEKWAHRKTLERWRSKFAHYHREKFELTMRSTKGVSKHHPNDYQTKVLKEYQQRLEQLQSQLADGGAKN